MDPIRPFTPDDTPALLACIAEHQDYHRALEPEWPRGSDVASEYLAYLQAQCAAHDGCILLATESGSVIGFVCIAAHDPSAPDDPQPRAWVHDLFVHPASRRRGLATMLMKAAEAFARDRGVPSVRLAVLERNVDARSLYRRLGFRDYARILTKPLG
jgi:ribosomal protein S18 acetylase RimI-like enzyme